MYRKLSEKEIKQLVAQGCEADSWDNIEVTDRFSPDYVRRVSFRGDIRIGAFNREFSQPGGYTVHSGLYDCRLFNVTIGDDCYIDRVHNYIANYDIEHDVFIENTNLVVVDGETTFGNGVRVAVMNEGGGRMVPIYDRLSAQMAYVITLYRHNEQLIDKINALIDNYAESRRSTRGTISHNVKIVNCGAIKDVYIGPYAALMGVSKLSNGSVNSNQEAPVHIGSGVKCNDFILSSGVDITDSTLVSNCFVGQATQMGKHYSAIDSLFFANCQGFHGEATAIFAGPYTVTHHKSTLLIAGMFSFMNAGSGSNQSNHMYKLGPIHQGLAERGSKTTSDSYILWPARIGAFTLVMGRHTSHPDTGDLPFSYLIENQGDSYLVPGVNIRSVGTVRDAQKWPKRDGRKDNDKIDKINFNLLSPYTIQKMMRGKAILNELKTISGSNNEIYSYHNCKIRRSSLLQGIRYYDMAIAKFMGNSLISRVNDAEITTIEELRKALRPSIPVGSGEWLDISGLIVPQSAINDLIEDIVVGKVTLEDIEQRFADFQANYYEYEWTWAYDHLIEHWNKSIDEVMPDDLICCINNWKRAVVELDEMLYSDARKEFDLVSSTGFGVDGDEQVKRKDFELVRGSFDDNAFVKACLNHMDVKSKLGDDTIEKLNKIK